MERGKLHQSAVSDRNALDISTALMFAISKLWRLCFISMDIGGVFFITLRLFFFFFPKENQGPWLTLFNKANGVFSTSASFFYLMGSKSKEQQKLKKVFAS